MVRRIAPPSPWRYACLASGEYGVGPSQKRVSVPARLPGAFPFRRLRLLDAPAAGLGAYCEAVRLLGGEAQVGEPRDATQGPGKIADAWCAAPDPLLRAAAERIRSANRDLAAAVLHSCESYAQGRPTGWKCGDQLLPVGVRPLVMGIVNLTPDSFSDGGSLPDTDAAEAAVGKMVEAGADLIDIGGESTRPRATPVSADEEIRRIRPLLERLCGRIPAAISVDTSKAAVARVALDLGATIVNDVTALADPEMLPLLASSRAGIVLMHMKGTPATMQDDPHYDDLVGEIFRFLQRRVRACVEAGIAPDRLAIDPGIGFGKTVSHNLELLARLREFTSLGLPVVAGPSRKGFLGQLLELPATDRVEGTAAACVSAVLHGASVVRVHDVLPVSRSVRVASAVLNGADRPV